MLGLYVSRPPADGVEAALRRAGRLHRSPSLAEREDGDDRARRRRGHQPAAQVHQEGRPDGGLRARGPARLHRGHGLPEDDDRARPQAGRRRHRHASRAASTRGTRRPKLMAMEIAALRGPRPTPPRRCGSTCPPRRSPSERIDQLKGSWPSTRASRRCSCTSARARCCGCPTSSASTLAPGGGRAAGAPSATTPSSCLTGVVLRGTLRGTLPNAVRRWQNGDPPVKRPAARHRGTCRDAPGAELPGAVRRWRSRSRPRTARRSPTPSWTRWRSMGGAFGHRDRLLSKAKEDWVLVTHGPRSRASCTGSRSRTLERIGGTPCVLLGLLSVKRTAKRDAVLQGRSWPRSTTARSWPSPTRTSWSAPASSTAGGLRGLQAARPTSSPGPATGPSARSGPGAAAWPSASASTRTYDEQTFVVKANGQSGFLDHETLKPEKVDPDVAALFRGVNAGQGRRRSSPSAGRWPRTCSSWAPALTEAGSGRPGALDRRQLRPRRPSTAHDRAFDPGRPVPAALLDDLVDLAGRAPSAGKAQGWHLVVLEGADTARFWDVTLPPERRSGSRGPGCSTPRSSCCPSPTRGLPRRYAEPDKAASGLGRSAQRLAGAVLDGRRGLRGHDAPAGGRGRGAWARCSSASSRARRSCAPRSGCPPTWSCSAPSPSAGPRMPVRPPGPLRRPPAAAPGRDHPPRRVVRLRSRPGCRTSPAGRCSPAGWRR